MPDLPDISHVKWIFMLGSAIGSAFILCPELCIALCILVPSTRPDILHNERSAISASTWNRADVGHTCHTSTRKDNIRIGKCYVSTGQNHVSTGEMHVSTGATHVSTGPDQVSNGEIHVSTISARAELSPYQSVTCQYLWLCMLQRIFQFFISGTLWSTHNLYITSTLACILPLLSYHTWYWLGTDRYWPLRTCYGLLRTVTGFFLCPYTGCIIGTFVEYEGIPGVYVLQWHLDCEVRPRIWFVRGWGSSLTVSTWSCCRVVDCSWPGSLPRPRVRCVGVAHATLPWSLACSLLHNAAASRLFTSGIGASGSLQALRNILCHVLRQWCEFPLCWQHSRPSPPFLSTTLVSNIITASIIFSVQFFLLVG